MTVLASVCIRFLDGVAQPVKKVSHGSVIETDWDWWKCFQGFVKPADQLGDPWRRFLAPCKARQTKFSFAPRNEGVSGRNGQGLIGPDSNPIPRSNRPDAVNRPCLPPASQRQALLNQGESGRVDLYIDIIRIKILTATIEKNIHSGS